jgi:hypothetical protein
MASFSFPPSFSYAVQSGIPSISQLFIALNIFLSMFAQRGTRGCTYTAKRQEERLLEQTEEVKVGSYHLHTGDIFGIGVGYVHSCGLGGCVGSFMVDTIALRGVKEREAK